MKKIFIISVFIILGFKIEAQDVMSFIPDSGSFTKAVMFSGYGSAGSSSLTSEFIKTWINSGFISERIKANSLERTGGINYAGAALSGKTYFIRDNYNTLSDAGNIGFFAGVETNFLLAARFGEDLFKLTFYGNKDYENDTAVIEENKFVSMSWQQAGGGIYKRVSNEAGIAVGGAGVNFVKGQQINSIVVEKASLFTAAHGNFLDVNADFNSLRSDTSRSGFGAFNGYGASLTLFYRFTTYKGLSYYLSADNLGFIRWNNKSLTIKHDTSFRFDGIKLNNIVQTGNLNWNVDETDSLLNSYLPSYSEGSFTSPMPCTLEAGLSFPAVKDRLEINFVVNHILFIPYVPKISVSADWHVSGKLDISPHLSYGGFRKTNAGIGVLYKPCKKFMFIAGSHDVYGILNPAKSSGLSAYTALFFSLD